MESITDNNTQRRALAIRYVRDFAIAIVVCGILAVSIDVICYLFLGATSAGTWYDKYWIGFFFCCAFIASAFIILRDKLADKPEHLYLIIVLAISLFMTWSLSTFLVAWDTGIHFQNVLGWADIDDQFELSRSESAYITTSLLRDDGTSFPMNLEGIYQMEAWLNNNDSGVQEIRTAYSFWYVITHINYVPCAFVMYFCEAFNASFVTSHFLSLLPSPLIYSFVTFFGMKKLKSGKMLYAVVALLPTVVFLVANYGYQYWNMAFFLYGFACLASFLQRKEVVPIREIALMLIALIFASLPRLSYAPLILLSLLTPKACFKSKRTSFVFRFSIIFATILTASIFAVPRILQGFGTGDTRGGSSIDPAGQVAFILSHPIEFLKRLFVFLAPPYAVTTESTYANDVVSGFLTPSGSIRVIGFYGYLGYIARPLFLLLLILITATTITDKNEKATYGWIPDIACIAMSFFITVCIIVYMYLDFNNVGENAFRGVQSRYLLPFLFPCLIFLGKHTWGLNGSVIPSRIYNGIVLGTMAFILLAGWWQIYLIRIY